MISRRHFMKQLAVCGAGLGAFASPGTAARMPNFLFILVDDLGWRDLGCFGSTFYETPHLDALSGEATRFTQAYAACPVCSPTRVSILTGKYPARMATTDWFGAVQPEHVASNARMKDKPLLPASYVDVLPLEEDTIAERLKEAGYATFFAGKWHLGGAGYLPEEQGFDVNKGGNHRGSPPSYFSPYENPQLPDGPEGEHLPDRLASETCAFMTAHRDVPFLAYLSMYSVHTPLRGREDLVEKYRKKAESLAPAGPEWGEEGERKVRLIQNHAVYGAMVESMDLAVGKTIDALKSLDLYNDTVVIFMSDNGGLSTSEGHPTSNLPLRAGKGWLYEGGIREPMIIRWPGVADRGGTCAAPVISTDFYPTMLQMAGLPLKPSQHRDGVSIVPLLRGEGDLERDTLFWHYPHYGNQGGSPSAAIRVGDWKLIEYYEARSAELFNIEVDLGEQHDRAKEMPEKVAELQTALRAWQREVGARYPSKNPDATR